MFPSDKRHMPLELARDTTRNANWKMPFPALPQWRNIFLLLQPHQLCYNRMKNKNQQKSLFDRVIHIIVQQSCRPLMNHLISTTQPLQLHPVTWLPLITNYFVWIWQKNIRVIVHIFQVVYRTSSAIKFCTMVLVVRKGRFLLVKNFDGERFEKIIIMSNLVRVASKLNDCGFVFRCRWVNHTV